MPELGGAILSGIFGLGTSIYNNQAAAERSQQDRRENYMYGEMAADAADRRTRALYEDYYSPAALVEQYKAAGMSPGLMMGGTPGQGGHNGAQGSGAAGIQTPYMPVSMVEAAQAAQLLAQAEKTKAETKQIEPLANATVSSLLADSGYKEAAQAAAAAQADATKLQNYITENTKEASIYLICEMAEEAGHNAQKAYYEMKDAKLLNEFNNETFEDRKKIVHQEMESLAQSIAESKSAEKLNDQQRKYLKDQILQNISMTMLEWDKYELSIDQFETFLEKQIPLMQKELEVQLEKLGIEKKRLIVDAVTDTFKSLAMGAVAASSMGIGKGGNLSPAMPKPDKIRTAPGKTYDPHKPRTFETNNVWSF